MDINTRKLLPRLNLKNISVYCFGILIFNLFVSPLVQASVGGVFSRGQSYALGLLGLVTFSLFIYLLFVIFQPEKF
ncbi:K(+)-transporting ATPase subunit F [Synechocystis sp. PCC 6714]|uniref:K(+)-transporting ATPase subunit F n=1 Tax=unclassified Synechocystis TaxID=2640012 RepID=UPI000690DBA1